MNFTLSIPKIWLHDLVPGYAAMKQQPADVRAALRGLLVEALEKGVEPAEPEEDDGEVERFPLSLPQPAASIAGALVRSSGLTPGPMAKRLLATVRKQAPREMAVDESDPFVALIRKLQVYDSTHVRPEQVELAGNMRDSLRRGKVGLVEGGTGTGKTRAMMFSAAQYALEHRCRVAIAAPTLALLRQLVREYHKQLSVTDMPGLRVVFGRSEFVSEMELRLMLAAPQNSERYANVARWVEEGGRAAQSQGIETAWLTSSLKELAPDFPVNDVRLPDEVADPKDAGYRAYRRQFEVEERTEGQTKQPEILLCSHAMLTQDMRTRQRAARRDEDYLATDREYRELLGEYWGRQVAARKEMEGERDALQAQRIDLFKSATQDKGLLPDFKALLIDEAHQFEENCANALSSFLALRALGRALHDFKHSGGRITNEVIKRFDEHVGEISLVGYASSRDLVNLKASTHHARVARQALLSIWALLENISLPKRTHLAGVPKERLVASIKIRHAIAILSTVSAANSQSYIRFSPQRAYPSVYIGATSVERILNTLWESLDAGVAVSATLYLKRHDGMSASYQRMRLAIPERRAAEYRPVEAVWSVKPVVALYTAGSKAKLLRPPTRADRLRESDHAKAEGGWLDNLAPEIHRIWETAQGGVLVLLPSYANATGIAERATKIIPKIVQAIPGYRLSDQAHDFMRISHEGHRPMWLAVGSAWTGLDIGGHDPWEHLFGQALPAGEDNVVTDLVVPRLPFGTNQSMSHLWRVNNRSNIPWELFETVIRFKQGLGRLVRRAGLRENRRIWVLDGRLQDVQSGAAYALFTQVMDTYPVRKLE